MTKSSVAAVRYRFALSANRRLVDVNDLVSQPGRSVREHFECFGCGGRLVAHLKDDLRARHFAHHRIDTCSTYETYLHGAAKAAFLDAYLKCLETRTPYLVRVPVVDRCTTLRDELGIECPRSTFREFDLTQWFDSASQETRYLSFQPDVLLMSTKKGRPMFVEIAVTHRCEQEKIDSGIRIVEISVASDADIAAIRSRVITVDESGPARAYNFQLKPAEGAFCQGNCSRHVGVFVVHRTGRPKLFPVPAGRALAFKPRSAVWRRVLTKFEDTPAFVGLDQREYVGKDLPPGDSLMQRASMAAVLDGVTVRTCEVCQQQGTPSVFSEVWCHVHRTNVHPSRAAECASFQSVRSIEELSRIRQRNAAWLARRRR